MLLPACFAALDHWLLAELQVKSNSVFFVAFMLGAFVVQVGLLGALCGRLIDSPLLRGIIYTWCWVLIDMQTVTASLTEGYYYYYWGNPTAILTTSLFAAQLGLVAIWAVLGSTRWVFRLPASLLMAVMLAVPLSNRSHYGDQLAQLFLVQTLVLLAICGVLRWQRFRLLREVNEIPVEQAAVQEQGLRSMQFGLRHVMIWVTSLAVMLGIARAFDLLSPERLSAFLGQEWVWFISAGAVVGMVLVVALWAGLGTGAAWLRVPLLALAMLLSGATLIVTATMFANWPGLSYRLNWRSAAFWSELVEREAWIVAWTCLAGGLTYAALLIYRTLGYRLTRQIKAKTS